MTPPSDSGSAAPRLRDFGRSLWQAVRDVAKSVTWLAGLIAALSALVVFLPQAWSTVFWRDAQYAQLTGVHAGDSLTFVTQRLGTPALVRDAGAGLVESVFVRRDHVAMTVSDPAGRVVLWSVLSCDRAFAPTFTTPMGSEVTLQQPLATAETLDGDPAKGGVNERELRYFPGITGSSLDQAIELGVHSQDTIGRATSWFVGVNGVCGDTQDLIAADGSVPSERADPGAAAYRRHEPANFYAEGAAGVPVVIEDHGGARIGDAPSTGSFPEGPTVSPWRFTLPLGTDLGSLTRL